MVIKTYREIKMQEVKHSLLRNEVPEETIILHPEKAKDGGTEHLEAFLKNPKGIPTEKIDSSRVVSGGTLGPPAHHFGPISVLFSSCLL